MTNYDAPLSGRPTLAAISLRRNGDGVAYAGLLLERAITAIALQKPRVLELSPASANGTTLRERAQFVLRVGLSQVLHRRSWWMFNHVGIARAQNLVPRFVRSPYAVLLCGIEAWDADLRSDGKAALRAARVRIAISEHTARRTAQAHPTIGPITVCPLALLPLSSDGSAIDREVLQRVQDRSVLIVGRMSASEKYKGHDELLESWPAVLEQVPGAQLVIAGRGDDSDRLREKASALGIADHVMFLGFVSDATLKALQERVSVFAMPSRGEGFGLVYLEAMSAGLPCLGSTRDAGAEVIIDGETGILVDPSDKSAVTAALIQLLTACDFASRLGSSGRHRFESHFTFERFCERLRPILYNAFG